jgi:uncharacterized protein YegJ (DUF2314 family)
MTFIVIAVVAVLLGYWLVRYLTLGTAGTVFEKDDPRLLAAKQQARGTLPEFWAALDSCDPANEFFALKFDLNHGRGLIDNESIWASDLERREGRIFGTLLNQPVNLEFKEGQRVEIAPEAIDDWGYFRDGVAQGHFVTRVMLESATPRVAKFQKEAMGWD